jgi:hypothetical protein
MLANILQSFHFMDMEKTVTINISNTLPLESISSDGPLSGPFAARKMGYYWHHSVEQETEVEADKVTHTGSCKTVAVPSS